MEKTEFVIEIDGDRVSTVASPEIEEVLEKMGVKVIEGRKILFGSDKLCG